MLVVVCLLLRKRVSYYSIAIHIAPICVLIKLIFVTEFVVAKNRNVRAFEIILVLSITYN